MFLAAGTETQGNGTVPPDRLSEGRARSISPSRGFLVPTQNPLLGDAQQCTDAVAAAAPATHSHTRHRAAASGSSSGGSQHYERPTTTTAAAAAATTTTTTTTTTTARFMGGCGAGGSDPERKWL